MLSPSNPLDEIQPNLVCKLLTRMRCATAHFFGPAPWGHGEGLKGVISLNFNYKVNFKDFLTKLCVSSHTCKIKITYHYNQTEFSFGHLDHAPGVGLGGNVGVRLGVKIFSFRNSTRFGV